MQFFKQMKDPHALVLRPESSRSGSESSNRPATAVRGAGYTSHSSTYNVLSQPSRNMIMSEPNKEERYNIIFNIRNKYAEK